MYNIARTVLVGHDYVMADPEDSIEESIKANAAGPKAATGDMGSVTEHSLKDQIEADRYLEAKKAQKNGGLGIKLFKIGAGSGPGGIP